MRKKLMIIYAKDTKEVFNRQSALGSYIHCLATILNADGFEVTINGYAMDALPGPASIALKSSSSGGGIKKFVPSFVKELLKDMRLFRWQDEFFAQLKSAPKADLLLEFYTYGSEAGSRLASEWNIPLHVVYDNPVLEEHRFFNPGQLFFAGKIEAREKATLLRASNIVVYSDPVKQYLRKKYPGAKLNAFIHQNVDFTRFEFIHNRPEKDELVIGFVGSFLKWHRVDLLIKVFERISRQFSEVRLLLVGNGMEAGNIRSMLERLDLSGKVSLPGFLDGKELLEAKRSMDIGIMPGSNWYGAPNKIFEYGAAGIAVIAPSTPTIRDLFRDGDEVLLFTQDDEDSMYEMLCRLIVDAELRRALASRLQEKIRSSYSRQATLSFYTKLLTGGKI